MSDDFNTRYRLLKCVLVEDGTRTHNAQETASGRVVMVHITDAAGPDEVAALRAQMAALPASQKHRILDAVTIASGFAVVTDFLASPLSFRSWLSAHAGDAARSAPTLASPALVPTSATAPANRAESEIPPAASTNLATVPEADAPRELVAPGQPAADLAGSFTQIFGKAEPPPELPVVEYPLPARAKVDVALATRAGGDDVDASRGAVQPAVPAPPVAVAPVAAPPVITPVAPTGNSASVGGVGEFTRMFAPPSHAAPPSSPAGSAGLAVPAPAPQVPPLSVPPLMAPPLTVPPPAPIPVSNLLPLDVNRTAPPAPDASPASAGPVTPAAAPPSPPNAASSFGYDAVLPPSPPVRRPPGEFTMMFGVPETAAPMPDTPRPSPMREAPPPAFSPLTPERRLESPPIEPLHRVVSSNPNYMRGIQQDGLSPIAPNVVGGDQLFGGFSHAPPPVVPPAHASPLVGAEPPTGGASSGPASPGILPPPIFSSSGATPLSALGGAAPLVNASAGPSDFTRLISAAAEPVLPPLEPTAATTGRRRDNTQAKRRVPTGLVFVINALLMLAALLIFFVLRRPVPNVQQLTPARPVLPNMPTAPQLPTSPP